MWFATGGGKTETYLGLLVTAALLTVSPARTGVSAWSRFPLRMLSLQQTQRFAEALAGAELSAGAEEIGGAPISLGFYVGSSGTPNRIPVEARDGEPDPETIDASAIPSAPRMPVLRRKEWNAHGPAAVAAIA